MLVSPFILFVGHPSVTRLSFLATLLLSVTTACSGDGGSDAPEPPKQPAADPGKGEWVPVPRDEVAEKCRLDPDLLDEIDRTLNLQWGIVRYGRLCHEFYPGGEAQITTPQENFSATKTLGAAVVGIAAYQTRDLPKNGRKTGPLSDTDRVDHWLDSFTFNPDAQVGHVLGMVAYNSNLDWGQKVFAYDTVGDREINRLSDVVNTVIAQDPGRFGQNLEEFTQRFLFEPLGMRHSTWSGGEPNKVFAFTWSSPLRDMMRFGLMLLNDGVWSGERILGADWVYRMTHPSFEDAQLGYGYLTWLEAKTAASANCMPMSVHAKYPHGVSQATDCNSPVTSLDCSQEHDVGVWHANGLGGQLIIGMKGLDMVIVIKDFGQHDGIGIAAVPPLLWPIVRPAVVARDPKYTGDDAGFCDAYGNNRYAPDLR
jgi:hypothetical protein